MKVSNDLVVTCQNLTSPLCASAHAALWICLLNRKLPHTALALIPLQMLCPHSNHPPLANALPSHTNFLASLQYPL